MNLELQVLANRLATADCYLDVFGGSADKPTTEQEIAKTYRLMSRVLHPDKYTQPDEIALATTAFAVLGQLRTAALEAIGLGTYGKKQYLAVFTTKRHTYEMLRDIGGTDLCDRFAGTQDEKTPVVLTIARDSGDNDLMSAEATAVRALRAPGTESKWHPYIPELLDAITHRNGTTRAVHVWAPLEGFYSLQAVKNAYPGGVELRHAIWMFRRLLVAVGYAHDNKFVHGAVNPTTAFIFPEQRGLVLTNWCYSQQRYDRSWEPLKAVPAAYRSWYPAEILAKQAVTPALDICLAARTLVWLAGGDPITGKCAAMPGDMERFFQVWITQSVPRSRIIPHGWEVLEDFDNMLKQLGEPYHPRKFHPFSMTP